MLVYATSARDVINRSDSRKSRMRIRLIALTIAFWVTCLPVWAQLDTGDTSKYLADAFHRSFGTTPKLGWVMPNGTVVTDVDAKNLTILSTKHNIILAPQSSRVTAAESMNFVKKNKLACDVISDNIPKSLYLYATNLRQEGRNPQVLVLEHQIVGVAAGYEEFQPPEAGIRDVWNRMKLRSSRQMRKTYSVRQRGSEYYFTFAALYDEKSEMSKKGIFLQKKNGTVVGEDIVPISEETSCDGCGVPTYAERLQDDSPIMNMFSFSSFLYPVLMLNTSTVEGRAVSLKTFTNNARPSEYRLYEYVVNCL